MSQILEIIENQRVIVNGAELKLKSCCFCGSKTMYIQYRGEKYQMKCWMDTTCKNRTGWFDTLLEAVEVWNERIGVF